MWPFNKLFKKKTSTDSHEIFLKDEYRSGAKAAKEAQVELIDLSDAESQKPYKDNKIAKAKPKAEQAPKPQGSPRGFFEIKKTKDGRYVFNLYASNRVIVATSQTYSSAQSAISGIKSVIANAKKAPIEDSTLKSFEPLPYPKWEIYKDKACEYRFRLSAPNGSCVCHSQGYNQKSSCKNGIQSIVRTCENADIEKAYLNKN